MKGPKILLINLNKEKQNKNKIELEEIINLDDFIYYKNNKNNYELIDIISYSENESYIPFSRSFKNIGWNKYDNVIATIFSFEHIKKNNKVIPSLLFYSKI